ncbi:hypothetical protein KUTeg_011209 [Tegillarca granosa]|uniref:Uncharacterized protein n=1 Tax=Tegillarca granosa TaxID=220873 RepID=A0ABQ9F4P2_TEGGR|nr:hypothetical protein KUTeg_011209 [Tegillarca granosa]
MPFFATPQMQHPSVSTPPYQTAILQQPTMSCALSEEDIGRIVSTHVRSTLKDEIINEFKNEMKSIMSEVFGDFVKDLKVKIQALSAENAELRTENNTLTERLDDLEQYSRRNAIRISGVPESSPEDTDALVKQIASNMGIELKDDDIDRSHRTGKPRSGSNRQILVKFSNYHYKHRIMKSRWKLGKSPELKNIYINEDLTKKKEQLFRNARKLYQDKSVNKVWTWDGKVFLTDLNNVKHRIEKSSDLLKFPQRSTNGSLNMVNASVTNTSDGSPPT